jgi:hypothetical protein
MVPYITVLERQDLQPTQGQWGRCWGDMAVFAERSEYLIRHSLSRQFIFFRNIVYRFLIAERSEASISCNYFSKKKNQADWLFTKNSLFGKEILNTE